MFTSMIDWSLSTIMNSSKKILAFVDDGNVLEKGTRKSNRKFYRNPKRSRMTWGKWRKYWMFKFAKAKRRRIGPNIRIDNYNFETVEFVSKKKVKKEAHYQVKAPI